MQFQHAQPEIEKNKHKVKPMEWNRLCNFLYQSKNGHPQYARLTDFCQISPLVLHYAVALINDKSSVFGIVAAPVTGKIWHGSKFDRETKTDAGSDNIRIVMSKSHKNENDEKFLEFLDMNKVSYQIVEKGSSLKLCSLADNEADIYPRFGPTSEWDIAAAHAVLASYGGCVVKVEDNEELNYAKESSILNPYFIAFRNNALKSEFLPVLRDFFKKLV